VLVANQLPKLFVHLVTELAHLIVKTLARRSGLEARTTREKTSGGAKKQKELRVAVWHWKQKVLVARSRYPERENEVVLPLQPLELWAPCKPRWV
jgi:hypothetical protein